VIRTKLKDDSVVEHAVIRRAISGDTGACVSLPIANRCSTVASVVVWSPCRKSTITRHVLHSAYADLRMAQLMPLPLTISCSNKYRLILPSWFYLSGAGLSGWSRTKSKRAVKWSVCVCVLHSSASAACHNIICSAGFYHASAPPSLTLFSAHLSVTHTGMPGIIHGG